MATRRKTHRLRKGDILDVMEYPDGRYGAPGETRKKKEKPTKEQMIQINLWNKARTCRLKMLEYIKPGDYFGTWTYKKDKRPPDMESAKKHLEKAMRYVRKAYKKAGYDNPFFFRNIQKGTKGAWHIHFVINKIPGAAEIVKSAWEHGGTYIVEIKDSEYYDEDFTKLSNYMTKNENTQEYKEDGTPAKSRIKESSYNTSRNMQLPKPDVDKLLRWKKEVKPKKGYYIANIYEGINPLGCRYRRYTMIRLNRRI